MQIQAFHIRLSKEHQAADEAALNAFLRTVTVKKTATQFVAAQPNFWSVLVYYEPLNQPAAVPENSLTQEVEKPQKEPQFPETQAPLTDAEIQIFETLRHWRSEKANELALPNYMICHNRELEDIARMRPQTVAELQKIKGFGPHKMDKYGEEIIAVLNAIP